MLSDLAAVTATLRQLLEREEPLFVDDEPEFHQTPVIRTGSSGSRFSEPWQDTLGALALHLNALASKHFDNYDQAMSGLRKIILDLTRVMDGIAKVKTKVPAVASKFARSRQATKMAFRPA